MATKQPEKPQPVDEKAARDAVTESIFNDLIAACDKAKILFKTSTPTPDMVFGLYDRLFLVDSEDEGDPDPED